MLKAPESPKTPETTPMQEEEQKLRNEAIVKFSLPGNNFFSQKRRDESIRNQRLNEFDLQKEQKKLETELNTLETELNTIDQNFNNQ
jgi:hypothetical protein